jgi:hypothetical protein
MLRALTDLANDYLFGGTGLIIGRINFAWLAVCILSPDWPRRKLQVCDFFRRLGEAAAPAGEECEPCP